MYKAREEKQTVMDCLPDFVDCTAGLKNVNDITTLSISTRSPRPWHENPRETGIQERRWRWRHQLALSRPRWLNYLETLSNLAKLCYVYVVTSVISLIGNLKSNNIEIQSADATEGDISPSICLAKLLQLMINRLLSCQVEATVQDYHLLTIRKKSHRLHNMIVQLT